MLGIIAAAVLTGASFAPDTTNAPSRTRMVPVNCRGFQLKPAEDADEPVFFERLPASPDILLGPSPWVGSVTNRGSVIRIWPDRNGSGPVRSGAMFGRGQLLGFTKDGRDFVYPRGAPEFKDSLGGLWPEVHARETGRGSRGDLWMGRGGRMRLWFANPNSAGFLGAELALAFLFLALGAGKWRRIAGALGVLAGLVIVARTGSRGAMVAFAAGAATVAFVRWRKLLTRKGLVLLAAVVAVSVGVLAATGQLQRVSGTFTGIDKGNGMRVKVAQASVRMFADAPLGWHGGEVPGRSACLNWYVTDEKRSIRMHLLTLAELGWTGGFAYLLFWALTLGLCLRWARRGSGLPFALWTAFAAAGCFNPVYTEWSLWCLPVASLGLGLRFREELCGRRLASLAAGSGLIALAGVAALAVCGVVMNRGRALPVASSGPATLVNGADPKVWVVEDVPVLGGWNGFPGRDVQWQYGKNPDLPALGYVYGVKDLPREVECLVLPGRAAADYLAAYANDAARVCRAKRILFLSPSVGPTAVPMSLLESSDVFWLAGRFLAYRDEGYGMGLSWVRVVPGAEQYIPNWLSVAFNHFNLVNSNKTRNNANEN